MRLEWGSVQINPASTSFTLFNAFSLRKHSPNNSFDSRAHDIHSNGGCRYRSQLRQNCNVPCLGMSCVMSTCIRRHDTHMLAGFGSITTPHWQHNLNENKPTTVEKHLIRNTYVYGDFGQCTISSRDYWYSHFGCGWRYCSRCVLHFGCFIHLSWNIMLHTDVNTLYYGHR